MISDSLQTLTMNVLSKTQKMKEHLQREGLSFPATVDQGEMINRQNNVFRARLLLKTVFQYLRANDLDAAETVLNQMMTVLAMTRIRDPLVEVDFAAHLIANNMKVTCQKII